MSDEHTTLTIEEVAKRLRVNERTVQRLLERRELTGYKVGRIWRVDLLDLEDYVNRQKGISKDTDEAA